MTAFSATTSDPAPAVATSDDLERADDLRLLWASPRTKQRLQGLWWPRSCNITVELVALLPAVDAHLGAPLARISLNPTAWDHQPRQLYAGARLIRLAWFNSIDPLTVGIAATPFEALTLCVVPPDCPEATGHRLFGALRDQEVWPAEPQELLEYLPR